MPITRRHILALTGSGLLSRVFGAELPGSTERAAFDVDRLLDAHSPDRANAAGRVELRRYTASAAVMLFSIPLVSRPSVGSGYAVVEQVAQTISLQFGAGSYPESARGLNRLGFIQEAVVEERPGRPAETAWLAFMTTSKETSLDQAKRAMEESGEMVPYSASQGNGRDGRFRSRVDRLEFASKFTWRDIVQLVDKARGNMLPLGGAESRSALSETSVSDSEKPATFLYMVRQAILDKRTRTAGSLVFNAKEFRLETRKESDSAATAHFAEKSLLRAGSAVMRLDALLTEKKTGIRTPFRVWYDAGAERSLPLRFEYQARSFLRLTFEADAKAGAPPIRFAFKSSKENA
jgi:hypothetical protein